MTFSPEVYIIESPTPPEKEVAFEVAQPLQRDHLQEIRNLLKASDEFVAKYEGKVLEIAETVTKSIDDQELVEAVYRVAKRVEIALFQSGSIPVPDGYVAFRNAKTNATYVSHDPRIPYENTAASEEILSALRDAGLHSILEENQKESKFEAAELMEIILSAWRQSSAYALLTSFDSPVQTTASAPLSPYWRSIREGQIEQDIRRRHGLSAEETLINGSFARQELVRSLHWLDEEENPFEKKKAEVSGLERLKKFLWPYYRKAVEQLHSFNGAPRYELLDEEIHIGQYDNAAMLVKDNMTGENTFLDLVELNWDVPFHILKDFSTGSVIGDSMIYSRLTQATETIMQAKKGKIVDLIHKSESEYIDVEGDTWTGPYLNLLQNGSNVAVNSEYFDFEVGEVISDEGLNDHVVWNYYRYNLENVFSSESRIHTKSSIEQLSRTNVASVLEVGNVSLRSRLMTSRRKDLEPGLDVTSDFDMKITINDSSSITIPDLYGYDLVGKDGNAYLFRRTTDSDPYDDCTVQIDDDKRLGLANIFAEAGLAAIADDIRLSKYLTVSDLTDILKSGSQYVYDEGYARHSDSDISTIDDISMLEHDGILQLQCTGAAQVLRVSLNYIFGEGSSSVRSGFVVNPGRASVNAVGHMQTAFSHQGSFYILDSTPIGTGSSHHNYAHSAARYFNTARGYEPLHRDPVLMSAPIGSETQLRQAFESPQDVLAEAEEVDRNKIRNEAISEIHDTMNTLLAIIFSSRNNNELYKKLVELPEHDAARRSLSLVKQAKRNEALDIDLFTSTNDYLQKLIDAPQAKRAVVGADIYDENTLSQLSNLVRRLGELDWTF
ncbi:MAG: hypothetical protein V4611_04620 [Patescibacteria group bacterium]